MFIGHFALGFAAKRVAPHASLVLLFAAAQLCDLIWPVLVALGIEQVRIDPGNTAFTPLDFVSYPFSHSLVFVVLWGIVLGLVAARSQDRRALSFGTIAALVVSHWVLDFFSHRPDLPIYPNGPRVGLGLWNNVPATLAVELTLFALGLIVYFRSTRATDAVGRWASFALVGFQLLAYFGARSAAPPSVTAIWVTGIAGAVVILAWAFWIERHRRSV